MRNILKFNFFNLIFKRTNIIKTSLNLLLAAVSITFTYLLLEIFIFKPMLIFMPLKTHEFIDIDLRILSQSSKHSTIPQKYIALVGDSYAKGAGDWLMSSNRHLNTAFHSAHVIYQQTGYDVLSFGENGAGSFIGIVDTPITRFKNLNRTMLFKIPPPDSIIIYFYEGNDLNDNLNELNWFFKKYDTEKIYNREYFRNIISDVISKRHPLIYPTLSEKIRNNLFLGKTIIRLLKHNYTDIKKHLTQSDRYSNNADETSSFLNQRIKINGKETTLGAYTLKLKRPVESVNQAIINGEEICIPDGLQSPALELTDEEINLTIYVFEQCAVYLQKIFPSSKIGVVYIPSPLSSYQISSPKVSIQCYKDAGFRKIFDSRFARERSDKICSLVKEVTERNNFCFVDSRKYIRNASGKQFVHGPLDWGHLNRQGYYALAESVHVLIEKLK